VPVDSIAIARAAACKAWTWVSALALFGFRRTATTAMLSYVKAHRRNYADICSETEAGLNTAP
jgi:hypothetical protein